MAEFLENVKISHGSRSYVVYLSKNCHMLRFNTNRPLYGLPSKKGSKTSNVLNKRGDFLTSILAEFLENAKISHGSRSYVVYLSNELSHAKFNTNRPLYGLPSKNGSKTSNVLN